MLAVVGCGAAAEHFHLPAIRRVLGREPIWLVDPDLSRAKRLARRGDGVAPDHTRVDIEAAIVATPNDLHARIAGELLERGVAVLCEKPLATSAREAQRVAEAAVGFFRRCFRSTERVRSELRSLGPVRAFSAEEGFVYAWSASSESILDRTRSGGGVTIDLGSHVFDQLRYWLGELQVLRYEDDAHGGVEADARIELRAGDARGTVELSRTRELGSTIEFECVGGTMTASLARDDDTPGGGYPEAFDAQLRAFLDGRPVARGEDGIAVARAVDACYGTREPLPEPWVFETLLHA